MSWNMKGTKSNLGVKTASVKNNQSKFECLLEFTFICKRKNWYKKFLSYLFNMSVHWNLALHGEWSSWRGKICKIWKKQAHQKLSVKQSERTTMTGLWVTESIFFLFTVALPSKLCVFIHVLYWFISFLEMWKKLDLGIIWNVMCNFFFCLPHKIWMFLSLFTFEKAFFPLKDEVIHANTV